MKMAKKNFLAAFLMFLGAAVFSQDKLQINNDLSKYYDVELFKWDLSNMIMYRGLTSTVGNIVHNKDMVGKLESYADTKQYYELMLRKSTIIPHVKGRK
jgi:MFS-type transporter involved in bile tolerance (Atg22 family)